MAAASAPDPTPKEVVVDVPGDASTSFSIAVGAPLDGVLEVKTDHDWYAVQLGRGLIMPQAYPDASEFGHG
jgi:hypothetical protein